MMDQGIKQSDSDVWPSIVGSLLELTQVGSLEWNPVQSAVLPVLDGIPAGSHVEQVLTARYKTWSLRLYHILKRKTRFPATLMQMFEEPDPTDWFTTAALQVLDAEGKTVMTIPPMRMLGDLLRAVQYRNRPESRGAADMFVRDVLADSLASGPN